MSEIFEFSLFLLPFVISLISSKAMTLSGSDNVYHLLMIDAIRNNKHRLITTMPYFVGQNRHSYPQFLHWIFSFFTTEKNLRFARFSGTIGHLLSGVGLYFFAKACLLRIDDLVPSNQETLFLTLVALLYSCSPLNYDLFNAKNMGFSARGIGLFFGQLLTYFVILYLVDHSILFLIIGGLFCYAILLSSVFATQYMLGYTLLALIFFGDINLLIPILIGLFLFFLLHPKVAKVYFQGQFTHKKLYALYMAEIFILKQRFSIWRDLVYDFWIKLRAVFYRRESIAGYVRYVMTNPVVNFILGIPCLFLLYNFFTYFGKDVTLDTLILHLIIGLLLFLITSFRVTRFLGEPERYVEFVIGPIVLICAILYLNNPTIVYGLIVFCVLFIFARIVLFKFMLNKFSSTKNLKSKDNHGSMERGINMRDILECVSIESQKAQTLKVMSNGTETSKMLLSSDYQTFRHPLFQEKIGSFHFNDIYKDSYFSIGLEIVEKVIQEFKIDILVYDVDHQNSDEWDIFYTRNKPTILIENNLFKICKFEHT